MSIILKSRDEIALMREAGRINAKILDAIRRAIQPGVTTAELDVIAVDKFKTFGVKPVFLGYPPGAKHPFPATITVCINTELVHGIPSPKRVIAEGDIVSIDCGTYYKGFVGDSGLTVGVGEISKEAQRLLDVTEAALYKAIDACRKGNRTGDVSAAIQKHVESNGFSVIRNYTGHGVGRNMHEEPQVPNWVKRRRATPRLRKGMTFTMEPMVSAGSHENRELRDRWTVVMKDGSLSAFFEHAVAITDGEPEILTLP